MDEIQFLQFFEILGWCIAINLKFVRVSVLNNPDLVFRDIRSTSSSSSLATAVRAELKGN